MNLGKKILDMNWKMISKADKKRMSKQKPIADVSVSSDFHYIDDDKREHFLDINYVSGCNIIVPVIIDIHGGGWMYGSKEINKNFCMHLAKQGYVVANVNYTLAPEATIVQQVQEIFSAIKWVRDNCNIFNADMKNFYLIGDSAGGHLASLVSIINGNDELEKHFGVDRINVHFNAIGLISPVTNFSSTNPLIKLNIPLILGNDYKNSPYYKYISFKDIYRNSDLPPYYLITSTGDFARGQTKYLDRFLKSKNVEHQIHDWQRHNDKLLPHVFCVTNTEWEASQKAIAEMLEFFDKYRK